jgi:2-(3-amino-3-carboxypropyl)histidine synthase
MLKRVKAARLSFFHGDTVGVLVTTKTGQRGLKYRWAKYLEDTYDEKRFYYVVQNDINFEELNNFPFVDVWLNTACERIAYDDSKRTDKPILNIEDVDDSQIDDFPD